MLKRYAPFLLVLLLLVPGTASGMEVSTDSFTATLPSDWSPLQGDAAAVVGGQGRTPEAMRWQEAYSPTPDDPRSFPLVVFQEVTMDGMNTGVLESMNDGFRDLQRKMLGEDAQIVASEFNSFRQAFITEYLCSAGGSRIRLLYGIFYTRTGFVQVLGYLTPGDKAGRKTLQTVYDTLAVAPDFKVPPPEQTTRRFITTFLSGTRVIAWGGMAAALIVIVIWVIIRKLPHH